MTLPNDFSDRAAYLVRCAIAAAFGNVRDSAGRSPLEARQWLHEQLKYNDNSNNAFSDSEYIGILMTSLARAMSVQVPFHEMDDLHNPGEDTISFQRTCLEEIDRYRRIDEWIPSFHNYTSRAALKCKTILVRSKIIPYNPIDFLQYTSDTTSVFLRSEGFTNLMDLSLANNPSILRYFLFVLSTDPSPPIRDHLLGILDHLLGSVAIGTAKEPNQGIKGADDLVVENEGSTEAHQEIVARTTTIVGALDALRKELGSNTVLQEGLWTAISSPVLSLEQVWHLLAVCERLYIPHTSQTVVIPMQQYWSVTSLGKGRMVFKRTGKFKDPLKVHAPQKPALQKAKTGLKLSFGGSNGAIAPRSASPLASEAANLQNARRESTAGPPRSILKPPKPPIERASSAASAGSVSEGQASPESAHKPLKLKFKFGGQGKAGSPS